MDQLTKILKTMTEEDAKKLLSQLPQLLERPKESGEVKSENISSTDVSIEIGAQKFLTMEEDAPLINAVFVSPKELKSRESAVKREQDQANKLQEKMRRLEEKNKKKRLLEEKRAAEKIARIEERERLKNEVEAKRASKAVSTAKPAASLTMFGFVSNAVKTEETNDRLFTPFVPDKRVVPKALQLWDSDVKHESENGDTAKCCLTEASRAIFSVLPNEESSSLLHPLCKDNSIVEVPKFSSFNGMIEASNAHSDIPQRCPCNFHVVANPHDTFDNEVIFAGFSAIGYEPCQSRPPYFGTFQSSQCGLSTVELFHMARFSLSCEMPRLCNVDYDYDSGDDWDIVEGDDIISSSDDDSDGDSLNSSDMDFINDDDGSDSDGGWQRKTMEARQKRMMRLKGKERLVPSFSGPFIGLLVSNHPLRQYDRLERVQPLDKNFFTLLLQSELLKDNETTHTEENTDMMDEQQKLITAALKNRREMTAEELEAIHLLIKVNAKISQKGILEALYRQQLCSGVPKSEVTRTIRRYYERTHGMYVKRQEPWSQTDERLFQRKKKLRTTENQNEGEESEREEDVTPQKTSAGQMDSSDSKLPADSAVGSVE